MLEEKSTSNKLQKTWSNKKKKAKKVYSKYFSAIDEIVVGHSMKEVHEKAQKRYEELLAQKNK